MEMLNYIHLEYLPPEEFIKSHKHIKYCEALIRPDGTIANVHTSHQNCLVKEWCDKNNIPYGEALSSIKHGYYEETLINDTGIILIWYVFCKTPEQITPQQEYTLDLLKQNAPRVIAKDFEKIKIYKEEVGDIKAPVTVVIGGENIEKGKPKATDIEAILESFGYSDKDLLEKNITLTPNPQYITPINALISSLLLLDKELEKGKTISLKFDYDTNSDIGLLRYTIK